MCCGTRQCCPCWRTCKKMPGSMSLPQQKTTTPNDAGRSCRNLGPGRVRCNASAASFKATARRSGLGGELVGLIDVSEQFFAQSSCTRGHPLLGSGPLALTSSISPRNERKALFHTGDTLLGWRNGRRVRLRGVWGNLWGFESPPEHHFFPAGSTRAKGIMCPSGRQEDSLLWGFGEPGNPFACLGSGNRAGSSLPPPLFARLLRRSPA